MIELLEKRDFIVELPDLRVQGMDWSLGIRDLRLEPGMFRHARSNHGVGEATSGSLNAGPEVVAPTVVGLDDVVHPGNGSAKSTSGDRHVQLEPRERMAAFSLEVLDEIGDQGMDISVFTLSRASLAGR